MKTNSNPSILCGTDFSESARMAGGVAAALARNVICVGNHTRPGFLAKLLGSITAHHAFLTREALGEVARVTATNILRHQAGEPFLEGTVL